MMLLIRKSLEQKKIGLSYTCSMKFWYQKFLIIENSFKSSIYKQPNGKISEAQKSQYHSMILYSKIQLVRSMLLRHAKNYIYFLFLPLRVPSKIFQQAFNKSYRCIIIITARENRQQPIKDGGWFRGGRDIYT